MVKRLTEAAELIGRSRQTLTNWIENGVLPAKKINGTYYVSMDAVEGLLSELNDLESAKAKIDSLRAEYQKEADDFYRMKAEARLEHDKYRYLSICVNSGLRTNFFISIINMLKEINELSDAECKVLTEVLRGEDLADIAKRHNTTRERVRKLAESSIRKSNQLLKFSYINKIIEDYKNQIQTLESELKIVKRIVYKKAASEAVATLNEVERKIMAIDKNTLNGLLAKRIYDSDLSVRALNILYAYKNIKGELTPIKTVGDLCRTSPKEFLIQRNAGKKTMKEIEAFLDSLGLSWDVDIDKIIEMKL